MLSLWSLLDRLYIERGHALVDGDGGKPFLNFLILSGLGQWINMSAFDLPPQSGGTSESQGTFECKLT